MDPMPAVVAVGAVLAAALWWLRKKALGPLFQTGTRRSTNRLESMERLAISPHHILHLVRLDDHSILIAQSPSGLALLDGAGTAAAPGSLRAASKAERA
jgi:hypothetical protein